MRRSGFYPLGYPFKIVTHLSPAEVRAAFRERKKGWFDSFEGPRGWTVGRLFCLWNSAINQYGPMVIGWISNQGKGSRITGRAGSDLNGTIAMVAMVPLMLFLLFNDLNDGDAAFGTAIYAGVIAFIALPFMLWIGHKDRRDADPLVSFIRHTTEVPEVHGFSRPKRPGKRFPLKLDISGTVALNRVSEQDLYDAIVSLSVGDFLILGRSKDSYVQMMLTSDKLVFEKRLGSAAELFAVPLPRGETNGAGLLDQSQHIAYTVMCDFLNGRPLSDELPWERVSQ